MIEQIELRVNSRFAQQLFRSEGEDLGMVRRVIVPTNDNRLRELGRLKQEVMQSGNELVYYGWELKRKYSSTELTNADLFHLQLGEFEPTGEECGTLYDLSNVCPRCGVGRVRTSPLILDLRRVPKTADIVSTIGGEWIISARLAELLYKRKISGFETRPVFHKGYYLDTPMGEHEYRKVPSGRILLKRVRDAGWNLDDTEPAFIAWLNSKEIQSISWKAKEEFAAAMTRRRRKPSPAPWFELIVTGQAGNTVWPTRFGIDPLIADEKGDFRCPVGHTSGLNLVSEIHVNRSFWDRSDIATTSDYVGIASGLRRPEPMLLVSKRVWELLRESKTKRFRWSVAYLR